MDVDELKAFDVDETRRGGFMKGQRPSTEGAVVVSPVGRARTASDRRAFLKRVAKRRAKKGYR